MNEFKLQSEEIQDLKLTIDTLRDYLTEANEEIDRLNKIIDKLEQWLKDEKNQQYSKYIKNYSINNWVLNKLQELKEEGKK